MPAFVFSRDGYPFHRVYISTDEDCVNIVHVGSVVSGTVYAPRVTGPLALNPADEHCGAMIRADAYGYACPGDPARAAALAHRDATLTHRRTGV